MSIKITCLQCNTSHKVNDRLAGKRVRCPQCDTVVHVPELPNPQIVPPESAEVVEVESVEAVEAFPVEAVEPAETVALDSGVVAAAVEAVAVDATNGQSNESAVSAANGSAAKSSDSGDDDDDETVIKANVPEDELDMTPMVDVTFLLLIFFVVTASFQLQKSIFMPRQKTDAPSTSAVEEDPEEKDQVELQIDEEGSFLVLGADSEVEPLGKQALVSALREARGDAATKLIIKVQEQAKLQSLVDGMDSGTIAGYDELEVTQVEDF